jgi:tRNA(Ile)-lysidine synthase
MTHENFSLVKLVDRAWLGESWCGMHVAVALSGGADSVALLRAVLEIKRQAGGDGEVCALHVNHRLRGAESDEDADWCERLCRSLDVPLVVLKGDAAGRAADDGDGIEAAARAERYELLGQAAERRGARYLATAHTRDDQVETVLLRLLRGAGQRGLRGIPRTRALTPALTLVRPLLDVSRDAIVAYLAELDQPFRTDSSNLSPRFTRNRVRNQLLPLLRTEYGAEIDGALVRLAAQADDAQQLLEGLAAGVLARCDLQRSDAQLSLLMEPLRSEPMIIVCEALRMTWREARLAEQAMTFDWWQSLAKLAQSSTEREVLNLPGNVRASTTEGRLLLEW